MANGSCKEGLVGRVKVRFVETKPSGSPDRGGTGRRPPLTFRCVAPHCRRSVEVLQCDTGACVTGLLDLIVAVGLGVTTNPGPTSCPE
jgi:hypothetical protein